MSRVDALIAKMEEGGRNNRFLKLKEGQQVIARLFGPYSAEDEKRAEAKGALLDAATGILVIHQHKFLPAMDENGDFIMGDDGKHRVTNYRCTAGMTKVVKSKKTGKRVRVPIPCGFCKFFDALGEGDKQIKRDHGREARAVIDLWNTEIGAAQRFFFSKRTLQKFSDLFGYVPNVNDPKKGSNIVITRTKDQFDPYTVKKGQESRLKVPEDEWPDILDELDNLKIVDPDTAAKILKAKFGKR
jgi:hypothetical protein